MIAARDCFPRRYPPPRIHHEPISSLTHQPNHKAASLTNYQLVSGVLLCLAFCRALQILVLTVISSHLSCSVVFVRAFLFRLPAPRPSSPQCPSMPLYLLFCPLLPILGVKCSTFFLHFPKYTHTVQVGGADGTRALTNNFGLQLVSSITAPGFASASFICMASPLTTTSWRKRNVSCTRHNCTQCAVVEWNSVLDL